MTAEGREHDGWIVHESGPKDAQHAVLLIPGGLCTAAFYDELVAEEGLSDVRMVATTIPGFGDTPPLDDLSFENYARSASKLAADLGCDTVLGHSIGGNIAIEMSASGEFSGPVVLLAPTFSTEDEYRELRILDRMGRVPGFGPLMWGLMMRTIGGAMKAEKLDRHDELVAEMKQAKPGFCRRFTREYFAWLRRRDALVPRLCESGVNAWVVIGNDDKVGLTDVEKRGLTNCPTVTMIWIPDVGHMTANHAPGRVAEVVREAVASGEAVGAG